MGDSSTNSSAIIGRTSTNESSTLAISLHSQSVSTKLDDVNYMLWNQQVLATIEGFDLEKFLDKATSAPDQFIPGSSNDEIVINPAYLSWKRQDKLIISWLLASMSESVSLILSVPLIYRTHLSLILLVNLGHVLCN